ncbi:MAG: multidrug efflux SMR transporter [Alistipes sp.]|nr:multidrug efflux SMR transporter [Alistipes sp.]
MKQYIFLLLAIIFEVAWAVLLKYTDGFTRLWPSVATLATYLAALYFLNLTVQTMPVGIAYAVWAGTGMVLIALFGVVVLKQHLDIPAIVGLALIVAGVLVLNLGSKSVTH